MVGSGEPAGREQHDEQQRRGGEADHDGGKHQRLRQRIGVRREVGRRARLDDRRPPPAHPPHDEDEQIDGVGEKRQADDHLEGARTQQQPDPRACQDADPQGDDELHQRGRCARVDWCASAISTRPVAPTTSANTPRSKKNALGRWTSPMKGSVTCAVCEVRKGCAKSQEPAPVAAASSSPAPIQRSGRMARRASAQRTPPAMYCRITPMVSAIPATKPPPGRLWPRSSRYAASSMVAGKMRRMITAGTVRSSPSVWALCCARCASGSMLSRAGRKRRRSEYTTIATTPRTPISPSVSKPRKSTMITFTTFVPPPSG